MEEYEAVREVEKQLQELVRQDEKIEEMKKVLIKQLDTFRDQYTESLRKSGSIAENEMIDGTIIKTNRNTTNSSETSTSSPLPSSNPTANTTPAISRSGKSIESTTSQSKLIEIKEPFLEVNVKSPLVIILDKNRTKNGEKMLQRN